MDQVDLLLPKWESGGALSLPGHPHEVAGPLSGGGRGKRYQKIHFYNIILTLQVALVNGVIPVADIVGPPMAGFLADKIGNFRLLCSRPQMGDL